ncbi:MAG TPA: hypothetical protein VNZ22_12145 [Bacillota bacterium]|nr:hypothetical protein [Bacillota bacterium]
MSRAKDIALEKAILMLLRPKVERYGELRQLSLDTTAKVVSAEIRLRGDPIPLVISEARYRVERNGKDTKVIFHGLKLSKEWAQNLVEDHFREIPLKIPDFLAPLIE